MMKKRIIVTPGGRKRYLEILLNYLTTYKDEFDRWDIWLNTITKTDIEYIEEIAKTNDFINVVYPKEQVFGVISISHFFRECVNENEIYLRLDDDIVFIERGSIKKMFDARFRYKEPFILVGNTINNAIISYLQQRFGNIDTKWGVVNYDCLDNTGWCSTTFAENLHRDFLSNHKHKNYYIHNWLLLNYEKISINVISWFGEEFKKFDGDVGKPEEDWLTKIKPSEIKKPNLIIGDTLFVHFAFFKQRRYLDNTNILEKYRELSLNIKK